MIHHLYCLQVWDKTHWIRGRFFLYSLESPCPFFKSPWRRSCLIDDLASFDKSSSLSYFFSMKNESRWGHFMHNIHIRYIRAWTFSPPNLTNKLLSQNSKHLLHRFLVFHLNCKRRYTTIQWLVDENKRGAIATETKLKFHHLPLLEEVREEQIWNFVSLSF